MARVGIKGHLSMERKYAQVQVQRGAKEPNQRTKTRKTAKKKKLRKPGCHSYTGGWCFDPDLEYPKINLERYWF